MSAASSLCPAAPFSPSRAQPSSNATQRKAKAEAGRGGEYKFSHAVGVKVEVLRERDEGYPASGGVREGLTEECVR